MGMTATAQLIREQYNSLLPEGSAWKIRTDGDFDRLLNGMAENAGVVKDFLAGLDKIRNPYKTPYLTELERDYGLSDTGLPDAERRTRLAARMYRENGRGTPDNLRNALDAAGFNVQVHINDPPANPNVVMAEGYDVVCGDEDAYCGNPDAVCGVNYEGEVVVNGDILFQTPVYDVVCGDEDAYCGNPDAVCGVGEGTSGESFERLIYQPPSDTASAQLFFFVGGDATRDGNGYITDIDFADVPLNRQAEFKSIVLEVKPCYTWAGFFINYV